MKTAASAAWIDRSVGVHEVREALADQRERTFDVRRRRLWFATGGSLRVHTEIPARDLEAWIAPEPTGAFARRAWFLHETLAGGPLGVPDATMGNYLPALDPERHVVAARRNSRRHRVADNLLGDARLCPTVRRTPKLVEAMGCNLDARARAALRAVDPVLQARAIRHLVTREARSSFAIEREVPSSTREE